MAGLSLRPILPWSGVLGGALGWFLSQQVGAQSVFAECTNGQWWIVLLIGLAGLACAALGGLESWRWSSRDGESAGTHFVGMVGTMVAALLAFPITMQVLSGLSVPGCIS